ncbi:hypothetical protein Syncc8109_2340 [Synechococcus sp. WH 8109]|nr:hypothetical protein Syncc8109_2340 [Synechococcus sp. WH 8109]
MGSASFGLLTAPDPVGSYQSGWANALQVVRWSDDDPS